ncbi:MAG TPA: MGMT family protein [Candidatus Eisenbergiella intestinipullorum]|nr:MGMT family protein [Candidatus Eisenbergiella intestinipullorum]
MDFYRRLALAGEKIPCGRVATYGQLALLCGKPRCSRQVGRALKYGLAGSAFPAYRVVNSRGILSGASSFDTPDMQKLLLEAEGVPVRDNRVDLNTFGWENTMEDARSLQKSFEEEGI